MDLHGLRHKEALEAVKEVIINAKIKGAFSLTIITGNSIELQKRIFENILKESNYKYYIPTWNLGQIIVEYMDLDTYKGD